MHRPRSRSGGGSGATGGGNLLTRRLCRTRRRRDDNELYRSNSFKFERFDRKEGLVDGSATLSKQVRGWVDVLLLLLPLGWLDVINDKLGGGGGPTAPVIGACCGEGD